MTLLTLDRVACAAPDGTLLFSDLTVSLGRERLGLVGRNGSGKSTLLRAIAGEHPLAAGSIAGNARIAMLRQLPRARDATVADALGVAEDLARLDRIEAGAPRDDDLDRADWTLASRLDAASASAGLAAIDPARPLATLSGGERTRMMLAGMLLEDPEVLLLDEPTNNLDAAGREAVAALLAGWNGAAVVASHDRALLSDMDAIVELTRVGVHRVGGGWEAFAERREAERERAARALDRGEQALARARREKQRETEKQAHREAKGRRVAASRSEPKILLGARKRRAEATAGRIETKGGESVARAEEDLADARGRVEVLDPIRIALPPSGLSANRVLVEARAITCERGARRLFGPIDVTVRGPARIAIAGPNGSGKTSLVRILVGEEAPTSGDVRREPGRIALLDQELALLGSGGTVLESLRRLAPELDANQARAALAAYGFRNAWAEREVASLSGGERVRLALAGLFSRAEPPQLLVLDEPSNHLDVAALEMLEAALRGYDGAIVCVSHDAGFIASLAPTETIVLG
ncbi:hypothetical protein B2G71_00925 [Novosphingobium sp. PC22D]|uniref:ABC-F family ATP-binding cassette domain-containing protein n=1 Tax=Novosphingobium sp. PC22D TaxID=1962403 RepID=UPI000BF0C8C4|nr:ABC-F family ATP-binding cassette domain-containing protein [Novosphingobium sp. PC22D]PEQ14203.1 hypothetical protein B2G71_00925 [Novosphingobium sp. PC22D]